MTQKKKLGRKLLSFLLTLALVLGLMPGMSLTAYAEEKSGMVVICELEVGDILGADVTYLHSPGTIVLKGGGYYDDDEEVVGENDYKLTSDFFLDKDEGSLVFYEDSKYYPYGGGNTVKSWEVVSVDGEELDKTITLTGYYEAPQSDKPVDDGLQKALELLSAEDREIVYLFYYEGYTAKEIGAMLGKNEKTVAKRLSRSREKLKKYLTEEQI